MANSDIKFSVSTRIDKNILTGLIEVEQLNISDRYYFYLLRYGVVIERSGWINEHTHQWVLSSSGIYSVQAHVKRDNLNLHKISIPVFFSTSDDLNIFEECLNEPIPSPEKIPFHNSTYPYQDFALLSTEIPLEVVKLSLAGQLHGDIHFHTIDPKENRKIHIISTRSLIKNGSVNLAFSGITRSDDELIYGDDDLTHRDWRNDLHGSIGNFSAVVNDKETTRIITDYFGVSKVYYYKSKKIFIASNRYHLLLIILKSIGVKLTPKFDKILANLTFVNLQPLHQNFTREMEVENIFALPVDKFIEITKSSISIKDAPIAKILRDREENNGNKYHELLHQAANEIIDNVNIALKHPRFEHVICDLSGGMDSRMVYAALTNLPAYREKIRIASNELTGQPNELATAISINNCYKYKYDDLPRNLFRLGSENIANQMLSVFLGSYHSYRINNGKSIIPDALRLTGMYGEIVARPYYSRRHIGTYVDVHTLDEFVENYFERLHHMSTIDDQSGGISTLKQQFKQELSLLPGLRPLEQFDLHYLYYRCGLHCSDAWRTSISAPEWGPLQSKTLFKLKINTYDVFENIKLQLDMIHVLNPMLATLPYESPHDNADKESIKDY